MATLARLVARLQVETSRYVKSVQQGRGAGRKFADGLNQKFKSVNVIPNPAGLREFDKKLGALEKAAQAKVLRRAVTKAIKPALAAARQNIPVGDEISEYEGKTVSPGFAKRNIKTEIALSRDKNAASAKLGVTPDAAYAVKFVELGTATQAAQPWLVPAFESTVPEQLQIVADELKAGIDAAAKS